MNIASPFEGLQFPASLACEFFAVFSRFEFTLKECGFERRGKKRVEPAWWKFAEYASCFLQVQSDPELTRALHDLRSPPPQVQVTKDEWEATPLHGKTEIEKALDAVTRVRNNLFHGGKHTPHSPPGRDEKLVRASLTLLYACLEQNTCLRDIYEQHGA